MKIYVNGYKHAEIKEGKFLKPLIGINLEQKNRTMHVSGIYHDRIKTYKDGTMYTIVLGWKKPMLAIFLRKFFPFISFFIPKSETEYLEEE